MPSKRKQQLYKLSHKKWGDLYELLFEIDHQGFYVGVEDTKERIIWRKRQLKIALERMIGKVRNEIGDDKEDKDV